jgi:hypothetical protein
MGGDGADNRPYRLSVSHTLSTELKDHYRMEH